jgi:hypothetical protein
VQLLKETEVPIAATKRHGERVDYEYERNGTASIFPIFRTSPAEYPRITLGMRDQPL